MKHSMIVAIAGACGGFIACESNAAYLGLGTQVHTNVTVGFGLKTVYRVYAVFSDPDDYLINVGGSIEDGPLTIKSLNATGTGPGSNFYNPASGSNTAGPPPKPGSSSGPPMWDTFVTIGVAVDDGTDQIETSPGFPNFIAGNMMPPVFCEWFLPGAIAQGQAGGPNGKPNVHTDSDEQIGTGIMIAQLIVNAGHHVAGTVAVKGQSGGEAFTATNQTFFSTIPAPSPLLLAVAGLFAARRRR